MTLLLENIHSTCMAFYIFVSWQSHIYQKKYPFARNSKMGENGKTRLRRKCIESWHESLSYFGNTLWLSLSTTCNGKISLKKKYASKIPSKVRIMLTRNSFFFSFYSSKNYHSFCCFIINSFEMWLFSTHKHKINSNK